MNSKLANLQSKLSEMNRLTSILAYYEWLEEHGLSWNMIREVREAGNQFTYNWAKIPMEIRKRYNRRKFSRLIVFKLVDGTTRVLPWPPFHDDVIFNRSRLEKETE